MPVTKKPAAKKASPQKAPPTKKATDAKAVKPAKAVKAKAPSAKKPNTAFMKPMNISPALAAVIGTAPLPRTEVTKKIWEYIKKNKLQDEANKRMINGDTKLAAVFGGKKQVSMFEMTKLVSSHLS
jgi:chromatin remodeling complex protein RSC6